MNIFKFLSCGVYVVSSENSGCIINTLMQVNSKDPLVSISLNKTNYTNEIIKKVGKFAVSILNIDSKMDLISDFGFKTSKEFDKFKVVEHKEIDGINVLTENVLGYIICEVKEIVDCDTHDLFIAKVISSEILADGNALTYEYYYKVLKGTTPLKAPSYIHESELNESGAKRYQCIICGHIYDDSKEEVNFEDLPDDWVCPKCRVGKDKFKLI